MTDSCYGRTGPQTDTQSVAPNLKYSSIAYIIETSVLFWVEFLFFINYHIFCAECLWFSITKLRSFYTEKKNKKLFLKGAFYGSIMVHIAQYFFLTNITLEWFIWSGYGDMFQSSRHHQTKFVNQADIIRPNLQTSSDQISKFAWLTC